MRFLRNSQDDTPKPTGYCRQEEENVPKADNWLWICGSPATKLSRNRLRGHVLQPDLINNVMDQKRDFWPSLRVRLAA
jgi:hypothetical protein